MRPWRERIEAAKTLGALADLRRELAAFRVLDPACGSGNFLYVAFRELKRLELDILLKAHTLFGKQADRKLGAFAPLVSTRQFFGIDNNPFAVELAKVTLMLAKELAIEEIHKALGKDQPELELEFDRALPLDNLDQNVRCEDALFTEWPPADAIIGNPPYQSKNKMQGEYGRAYLNRLRNRYREIPGRADYCVYWFRRAHGHLKAGGRAGLVGTNTIRQNYSREGGLDHIVATGGTITEAVSTQVWSGDAVVHVSIVNWLKGEQAGSKRLFAQRGNSTESPWEMHDLDRIGPSLTADVDTSTAVPLLANSSADVCYQGQTHGHEGFLLSPEEARAMLTADARNAAVLHPLLIGDDLLTDCPPHPRRFVIDFAPRALAEASAFKEPFRRVKTLVLPDREEAAALEAKRNKEALAEDSKARVNVHHGNFLKRWWHLSYPRQELLRRLTSVRRYLACVRVTKRPIFEFIDVSVHPGDALQVFVLDDDYSFGVLQSTIHWEWFVSRCSTMKADPRYTSQSVFDTFPWPQTPSVSEVRRVAQAGRGLRAARRSMMTAGRLSLRELYRLLDLPGTSEVRTAQASLDKAVAAAYSFRTTRSVLGELLELNRRLAAEESAGRRMLGPGIPPRTASRRELVSDDRVT